MCTKTYTYVCTQKLHVLIIIFIENKKKTKKERKDQKSFELMCIYHTLI